MQNLLARIQGNILLSRNQPWNLQSLLSWTLLCSQCIKFACHATPWEPINPSRVPCLLLGGNLINLIKGLQWCSNLYHHPCTSEQTKNPGIQSKNSFGIQVRTVFTVPLKVWAWVLLRAGNSVKQHFQRIAGIIFLNCYIGIFPPLQEFTLCFAEHHYSNQFKRSFSLCLQLADSNKWTLCKNVRITHIPRVFFCPSHSSKCWKLYEV